MFDDAKPRGQISARELRRAGQIIDKSQPMIQVGSGASVRPAGVGTAFVNDEPDIFSAVITAVVNPSSVQPQYGFKEVWYNTPRVSLLDAKYVDTTSGRTSDGTKNYAISKPNRAWSVDDLVKMRRSKFDPNIYEILSGDDGGTGDEVWARIVTPLPTADPGPYTAVGVELVAGVWQDKSPQVDYDEVIYRAPSNIDPPKIPAGQRVRLIPSPTDPDKWEIAAVGGMQTVVFYADNGWGCYAPEKVELTGRDLSVVVTPGGDSVKTITFGPVVTEVTFDAETCELSVTYMNVELNLCTLEGTFVEP